MELVEVWKDIPSFEGVYQVSNHGRLMSFKSNKAGLILSQKNSKGDYFRYVFKRNGMKKTILIHRLTFEVFVHKIPNGFDIDHIDGNKQNNVISNLQCLNKRQHVSKTIKEKPNTIGTLNYFNKMRSNRVMQFSLNEDFIKEYSNAKAASIDTGICLRNIHQVASKEEYKLGKIRKQAGGFIWKYKEAFV
jgi:hypothetical protein